jgi:hypothetical protein
VTIFDNAAVAQNEKIAVLVAVGPSGDKTFFASTGCYYEAIVGLTPLFDSLKVVSENFGTAMFAQGVIKITKKN